MIPGELPDELIGLPEKFFDAILICRVLHFFTGAKIEESLALLSKLLAPGGKIYIVCETPYLKNWQRFIPEFNKRVEVMLNGLVKLLILLSMKAVAEQHHYLHLSIG